MFGQVHQARFLGRLPAPFEKLPGLPLLLRPRGELLQQLPQKLPRRLPREGQREDLPRFHPQQEQLHDPVRQAKRLARSRRRGDAQMGQSNAHGSTSKAFSSINLPSPISSKSS